jgi:hypothetical protein
MPSFYVRTRKTTPLEIVTVDAENREKAIRQVVEAAAEGEEVEVLAVQEFVPAVEPPPVP